MYVKDWKELKPGEIFKLKRPVSHDWSWNFSLGTDGLFRILEKGSIKTYPNGHPERSWVSMSPFTFAQPIEVYEFSEISSTDLLFQAQRMNSTTGADPEIFVTKGARKRTLFPAFEFLPNKPEKSPYKGLSGDPRAWAYRDGFAAEFGIVGGACHGYMIDYLRNGLQEVLRLASEKDDTAKLSIENTFAIPEEVRKAATPEQLALGCLPSLNAYGDNPILPSGNELNLRFAGGHIHFGMSNSQEPEFYKDLVKGADLVAGIPLVAMLENIDSPARRQYYGRAGEYRLPKHGLEYRVLSNAWLAHPQFAHLVLNLTRSGLKLGRLKLTEEFGLSTQQIQDIINYCDVKAARKWSRENIKLLLTLIHKDGVRDSDAADKAFVRIIEEGMPAVFPTYKNLDMNWHLTKGPWGSESDYTKMTWLHVK